jgi:predicted dehydrogenase
MTLRIARNFNRLAPLNTICDTLQATLDSYGAEYAGARKAKDVEAVLADPGITRVAIVAPAALHYKLAKAALGAGKDVFVE